MYLGLDPMSVSEYLNDLEQVNDDTESTASNLVATLSAFEQTPGDVEGQVSLVCCSPWGHKGSDTT